MGAGCNGKGEFALPWEMEMLKGPKITDIDYQLMARDAKCNTNPNG